MFEFCLYKIGIPNSIKKEGSSRDGQGKGRPGLRHRRDEAKSGKFLP